MRPIKFRLWDSILDIMRYSGTDADDQYFMNLSGRLHLVSGDDIYAAEEGYRLVTDSTHAIMQYTGLKDKRGKEIYEGDILSFVAFNNDEDNGFGPHLNIMDLVVVDWEENHSGFVLRRTSEYNHRENMDAIFYGLCSRNNEMPIGVYAVVIGNIYENPELING